MYLPVLIEQSFLSRHCRCCLYLIFRQILQLIVYDLISSELVFDKVIVPFCYSLRERFILIFSVCYFPLCFLLDQSVVEALN